MRDAKLLLELHEHPGFAPYIRKVMESRPEVSHWNQEKTEKDWIYESGKQEGFDLAMSFFLGELE